MSVFLPFMYTGEFDLSRGNGTLDNSARFWTQDIARARPPLHLQDSIIPSFVHIHSDSLLIRWDSEILRPSLRGGPRDGLEFHRERPGTVFYV